MYIRILSKKVAVNKSLNRWKTKQIKRRRMMQAYRVNTNTHTRETLCQKHAENDRSSSARKCPHARSRPRHATVGHLAWELSKTTPPMIDVVMSGLTTMSNLSDSWHANARVTDRRRARLGLRWKMCKNKTIRSLLKKSINCKQNDGNFYEIDIFHYMDTRLICFWFLLSVLLIWV